MLGTIHTYRTPGRSAVDKARLARGSADAAGGYPPRSPILTRETRREVRVEFVQPLSMSEALEAKNAHPDAVPIRGGTDVMVALNFARSRPDVILDLSRVEELNNWEADDGLVRVGAGVSYTRIIEEIGDKLPGLAIDRKSVV